MSELEFSLPEQFTSDEEQDTDNEQEETGVGHGQLTQAFIAAEALLGLDHSQIEETEEPAPPVLQQQPQQPSIEEVPRQFTLSDVIIENATNIAHTAGIPFQEALLLAKNIQAEADAETEAELAQNTVAAVEEPVAAVVEEPTVNPIDVVAMARRLGENNGITWNQEESAVIDKAQHGNITKKNSNSQAAAENRFFTCLSVHGNADMKALLVNK